MKIVIRNNVFETNSSSTHSFTIASKKDRDKNINKLEEIKKELENLKDENSKESFVMSEKLKEKSKELKASFKIKSPLAKLVWLKGLIDNASEKSNNIFILPHDFNEDEYYPLQSKIFERVKKIKTIPKEEFESIAYWIEEYESRQLEELLELLYTYDQDYENLDKEFPIFHKMTDYNKLYKSEVLEFYDLLKKEYSKIENIPLKNVDEKVLLEGNKTVYYENILKDEANLKENVEELLKDDYYFNEFAKKYKDKVNAFKNYVKIEHKKNCEECNNKISCHHYFCEGALDECDCGFDCFSEIKKSLDKVRKNMTLKEFAKEFISEKFVVLGYEYAHGFCFWGNGEVY